MFRLQKILIWGWIGIFFLIAFPDRPLAHAYIVTSTPAENEQLTHAPAAIRIKFNESIQPDFYSLTLIDQSGQPISLHGVHINKTNPNVLEADVHANLSNGTYVVKWKVVSSDGHPVEGTIPFQIGKSGKGATSATSTSGKSYFPKLDMIVIRGLFYVSMSLFLGTLFFNRVIYPAQEGWQLSVRDKILYWTAYSGIVVSTLLSLPLQITVEADVSWFQAWNGALIKKMFMHTSFGVVWLAQITLLFLLLINGYFATSSKCESRAKRWMSVSLLIGTGILFAKAWTGHASVSPHPIVSSLMDFFHLFAASVWVGCLFAIIFILPLNTWRKEETGAEKIRYWEAIRKFSYWGIALVSILLMTGIYASFQQIPTFYALFQTIYGKVLIGKVVLFVIMLFFAGMNFMSGRRKKKLLGPAVWGEFSVGIGAMVLASILTNVPTAMASPGPFTQTKEIEHYTVTLQVTPNVLGENQLQIGIKDKSGNPVNDIEQVIVTLTSKEMDMGENTIQVPAVSPGTYRTKGMISMAGHWNIHVHALTKSLQSIDTNFDCVVGSQ